MSLKKKVTQAMKALAGSGHHGHTRDSSDRGHHGHTRDSSDRGHRHPRYGHHGHTRDSS